jgi:hypothetical protein
MSTTRERAIFDDGQAALIEADVALASAQFDISEPHRLDEVTVEFLTTVMVADDTGAKIVSAVADIEHAGMTDRRRLQLEWNDAGRRAALPTAVFLKATPTLPEHRTMLSVLHMAAMEARFFNEIRSELPDIAPHAYYAKSYPGGRFLIILEDLTLRGYHPYAAGDDIELHHARAVVTALGQLHATFWESPRFESDLGWLRPQVQRYGFPWLRAYFHQNRMHFKDHAYYSEVPEVIQRMTEVVDDHDMTIYEFWSGLPSTFLHGDSHLGNTYSSDDGTGGLLDWQVTFRGHGTRDLAYFISSALPVELRKEHEQDLFDLYLRVLSEGGVDLNRDEAWRLYRLFIVDIWDAHLATVIAGTFGHKTDEVHTRLLSTLADNEVPALVDEFVKHERL